MITFIYRVVRPDGTATEVKASGWSVDSRGGLAFSEGAHGCSRAFAAGHWAEIELIEPDPFTAATQAASAGGS